MKYCFHFSRALIFTILTVTTAEAIGTSFLTVPYSPRELALGGRTASVLGDASLSRGNPALIVGTSHQMFFSYTSWFAGVTGSSAPTNKKIHIALTYIFGIGPKIALDICNKASINKTKRVNELKDDEVNKIRELVDSNYSVEGDLRRKISMDIKRLTDLGCYRGMRHRKKLPVRGQRTHTNARTRKGKAVAIAGKKKVLKG